MVSRKTRLGAIATLSIAALLTGCAAGSDASGADVAGADETYLIYADVSLTGVLAASSQAQVEGLTAAVEAINADGGVDGRQLELKIVDDQLDASKATTLLQEQLDSRKPDFVYHGVSSNIALAMLPLLTRNEVFSMGTPSNDKINDQEAYPYAFALQVQASLDAENAVQRLQKEGITKVAMITNSDANGQNAADNYKKAFEDAGIDAAFEIYAPADLDMTAQLQRLRATDPEVLFVEGYGAPGGYVLQSRTKIGWDIDTWGTNSIGNGVNLKLVSSEEDWVNVQTTIHPINTAQRESADTEAFKTLIASLDEQGSKFDQSMQLYSYPWDGLYLWKAAVEQAGSSEAADVAEAMENLKAPEGERAWVTFPLDSYYSAENHFINLTPEEAFIYVNAGPMSRGTIEPVE